MSIDDYLKENRTKDTGSLATFKTKKAAIIYSIKYKVIAVWDYGYYWNGRNLFKINFTKTPEE